MVLVLPASGPLSGPTRTARGELDTGALLRAILADPAIQRANEDFLNKLVREAPVPATCRSACAMMVREFHGGPQQLWCLQRLADRLAIDGSCPANIISWNNAMIGGRIDGRRKYRA